MGALRRHPIVPIHLSSQRPWLPVGSSRLNLGSQLKATRRQLGPQAPFQKCLEDLSFPCQLRTFPQFRSHPLNRFLQVWGHPTAKLRGPKKLKPFLRGDSQQKDLRVQFSPSGPREYCSSPLLGPWGFLICFQSVNICN